MVQILGWFKSRRGLCFALKPRQHLRIVSRRAAEISAPQIDGAACLPPCRPHPYLHRRASPGCGNGRWFDRAAKRNPSFVAHGMFCDSTSQQRRDAAKSLKTLLVLSSHRHCHFCRWTQAVLRPILAHCAPAASLQQFGPFQSLLGTGNVAAKIIASLPCEVETLNVRSQGGSK